MKNKYLIIRYLFLLCICVILQAQIHAQQPSSLDQRIPQLTRETPDDKAIWLCNNKVINGEVTDFTNVVEIGEQRFFSVFIYVTTTSGSPNIDVYFLGGFENSTSRMARALNGTYIVFDNFTTSTEWVYNPINPAPCQYACLKIVGNSGNGNIKVSCVLYKTGS